jgi:hypothetical protein
MPDYGFGLPRIVWPRGNDFVVANPAYPQRVDVARQDQMSNIQRFEPVFTPENRSACRESLCARFGLTHQTCQR